MERILLWKSGINPEGGGAYFRLYSDTGRKRRELLYTLVIVDDEPEYSGRHQESSGLEKPGLRQDWRRPEFHGGDVAHP